MGETKLPEKLVFDLRVGIGGIVTRPNVTCWDEYSPEQVIASASAMNGEFSPASKTRLDVMYEIVRRYNVHTETLEALKEVKFQIERVQSPSPSNEMLLGKVTAAIQKAEGN